jgi:hypothetical protein
MDVAELARIVLTLLAMVGVGWLLRAFGVLSAADARPIHALIVYVGLPALIFRAIHPASLDIEYASWRSSHGWSSPSPQRSRGALPASCTCRDRWPGASSSPPRSATPATSAIRSRSAMLGDEGLVRAIFYDAFGTVGALLVVGLLIAQRYGDHVGPRVNPLRRSSASRP